MEVDNLESPNLVINCGEMPSTSKKKSPEEELLKTKEADLQVFKRFAVGYIDSYDPEIGSHLLKYTWHKAFTVCSTIGVGWRLPTKRELTLIFILHKSLFDQEGSFEALDTASFYWCATEDSNDTNNGWCIHFLDGGATPKSKGGLYRVRCIKEPKEAAQ